jgi:hypothetical protein
LKKHLMDYQRIACVLFVTAFLLASVSTANGQAPTSTALAVTPSATVTYGAPQTFTATVTAGTSSVTTGTVTFSDTTTNAILATGVGLNGSGQAVANAVLRAGGHNIQATYVPDPAAHTFMGSLNSAAVTVNKATLTVTAQSVEIPYSVLPLLTYSISGFVNGDSQVNGSVSGSPLITTNATLRNGVPNAGIWMITPAAGTLTSANYNFTFVAGTLTVDKGVLTVAANDATMIQGSRVPIFTWRFFGLLNGDVLSPDVYSGTPSVSSPVTPDSDPGMYTITITQGTLAAPNYSFQFVNGTLTVLPNTPLAATITITAGSPQSTTVNTPFGTSLQITVLDQLGAVIPNAPVTFTAPTSGASLSITVITATTDANGVVSQSVSANMASGSYTVTVTSNSPVTASFHLTNKPDVPATVTAVAGTPQATATGTSFASPLQATVADKYGNPVSGATVTFAVVRTTDAGANFPNGSTSVTNDSGSATISVRANSAAGTYNVTASTGSATSATFTLTNLGQLTVFAPALMSGAANQFGFAWTNPLPTAITLTLTARDYSGQLITGSGIQNPAQLTVAAHAQLAKPTTDIFGSAIVGRPGWIQVDPSDPGTGGFFLLYDSGLSTVDGGSFVGTLASSLYFPQVNSHTVLHVVNTGSQPIQAAALIVYNNDGAILGRTTLPIPPQGGWSGQITDVLPALVAVDGYATIDTLSSPFATPSTTLVGMASYSQSSDTAITVGQDPSNPFHAAYGLHVVSGGGYTSTVKVINIDSVQQQIQLSFNGTTAQRTIPPNGRLNETLDHLFNLNSSSLVSGYISLQTTSSTAAGLLGFVEISASGGSLLTAEPFASETELQLTFSQVAQGAGFFTGMAFLNADPSVSASVTVEVDSATGAVVASKVITLNPGQRFVGLLTDLFPALQTELGGSIRITSNQPIFALEIFGSTGQVGSFFATVPAANF